MTVVIRRWLRKGLEQHCSRLAQIRMNLFSSCLQWIVEWIVASVSRKQCDNLTRLHYCRSFLLDWKPVAMPLHHYPKVLSCLCGVQSMKTMRNHSNSNLSAQHFFSAPFSTQSRIPAGSLSSYGATWLHWLGRLFLELHHGPVSVIRLHKATAACLHLYSL